VTEGVRILAVTDEAVGALNEVLEQADSSEDQTLRLVEDQGQYRFTLDEEREGDQVIKNGERPVLVIASEVSQSLEGVALEFADAPDGGQLRLAKAS
jgi:Fe-S cluster assembly iron-binding protein IscA